MKYTILLLAFALFTACSSRQEEATDGQDPAMTGTAEGTMSGEIITADNGYIIQNAGIAGEGDNAVFSIKGAMKLKEAPTQLLVVRTQTADGAATEMLVVEFPSFADGTALEIGDGNASGAFWIFGLTPDKTEIMKRTGEVAGTLRLIKTGEAENALGLGRAVSDGIGEMEVVVSGIDPAGLDVQTEKKYAARFRLPMLTLDEFARINQPI